MKPLIFNKDNFRQRVGINKETAFIRVRGIIVRNHKKGDQLPQSLIYELSKKKSTQKAIGEFEIDSSRFSKSGYYKVDQIIDGDQFKGFDKLELSFNVDEIKDLTIEVEFTTENINVSIEAPFQEFKAHFEESNNAKILFSAPFGQGKTTFLKEFFKNEKKRYEVFHLFPVNYAVAIPG